MTINFNNFIDLINFIDMIDLINLINLTDLTDLINLIDLIDSLTHMFPFCLKESLGLVGWWSLLCTVYKLLPRGKLES